MSREEFYSAYTKRLLTPQRGDDSEEAVLGDRDLVSIAVRPATSMQALVQLALHQVISLVIALHQL
jgi:hypothetical protein